MSLSEAQQQLTLCRSLHAEVLQAIASEGLGGKSLIRTHDPLVERHRLYQCALCQINELVWCV